MWNWRLNRRPSDAGSQNDNVDLVIAYTIDSILAGHCNPGDKVKEADLARGTGLGVGYAREALQLMTGAKILERQQNHGYRVRQLDSLHLAGYLDTLELSLGLALNLIRNDVWTQNDDRALVQSLHSCLAGKRAKDETILQRLFEVFDILIEKSGSRYLPQVYLSLCPVLLATYVLKSLETDNRNKIIPTINGMVNDLIIFLERRDAEKSLASVKDIISCLRICLQHPLPPINQLQWK